MILFGTFFRDKMKKTKKSKKGDEKVEKKPKSFVLYHDCEDALLKLSDRERGILFAMIYSYAKRGNVDESLKRTTAIDAVFSIIRAQIDRDTEKYKEKCRKNAENGRLGGRPSKENENRTVMEKTERFFEKPKKAYNNNNNKNNSNNNTTNNNNNNNMRSFDADDFFAAALARSYGEMDREKEEIKEKEDN